MSAPRQPEALNRGLFLAIGSILAEQGVEAATKALDKLEPEDALETVVLAALRKAVEENGAEGVRALQLFVLRLVNQQETAEALVGPYIPLRETSDILAEFQRTEGAKRQKLKKSAVLVGHVSKPFVEALVATLLV